MKGMVNWGFALALASGRLAMKQITSTVAKKADSWPLKSFILDWYNIGKSLTLYKGNLFHAWIRAYGRLRIRFAAGPMHAWMAPIVKIPQSSLLRNPKGKKPAWGKDGGLAIPMGIDTGSKSVLIWLLNTCHVVSRCELFCALINNCGTTK